jgi:hypothetical protein
LGPPLPPSGRRYSGRAADDLRADLDQLFLQARQRPAFDRFGRRQRAQEVAETDERVKLETDSLEANDGMTGTSIGLWLAAALEDFSPTPETREIAEAQALVERLAQSRFGL